MPDNVFARGRVFRDNDRLCTWEYIALKTGLNRALVQWLVFAHQFDGTQSSTRLGI